VLCIALVWAAEALNTAIEALCDEVSPGYSAKVKLARDVGAGAVLVVAAAIDFANTEGLRRPVRCSPATRSGV